MSWYVSFNRYEKLNILYTVTLVTSWKEFQETVAEKLDLQMVWVLTTRAKFSVSRMVLRTPSSVSRLTLLNTLLLTFSTGSSRLTFPCHTAVYIGSHWTVRGFNVSNLMGIKRIMINNGKKITFYCFQNVWKCRVFWHFHSKFAKSAIMTHKFLWPEEYQYGYQKTPNFMPVLNSLTPTEEYQYGYQKTPNFMPVLNSLTPT